MRFKTFSPLMNKFSPFSSPLSHSFYFFPHGHQPCLIYTPESTLRLYFLKLIPASRSSMLSTASAFRSRVSRSLPSNPAIHIIYWTLSLQNVYLFLTVLINSNNIFINFSFCRYVSFLLCQLFPLVSLSSNCALYLEKTFDINYSRNLKI